MVLKIFNTLTREKEEFKPLREGEVRLYSCGPTVYNFAHIGNFRTYMFQDLLVRFLKYKGYKVIQVMNLTDVDDKTIKNSQKEGISLDEFTAIYKKAFFEDMNTLKITPATVYPEATKHISEMITMIQVLIDKGLAYKGEDGSIYYKISAFKEYGKLSNLPLDQLKPGARVKHDEYEKDNVADFALWKAWSEDDGDVKWDSPFGPGRPGWHIECSCMSAKHLSKVFDSDKLNSDGFETIDIHTGGVDLKFPHHEDEIAQSEGSIGKKFVNTWMHAEHLIVNGKKMSKSLGNFFTLRDLLDKNYKASSIRFVLLTSHYKSQLDFTESLLNTADASLKRLQEFVDNLKVANGEEVDVKTNIEKLLKNFEEALDDDLNIGNALIHVFDFVKDVNTMISSGKISSENAKDLIEAMKKVDSVLGLIEFEDLSVPAEVLSLAKEREEARKNKDFSRADELREKIKELGYYVDDLSKGGIKVKKLD